jgi:hypothetical protein
MDVSWIYDQAKRKIPIRSQFQSRSVLAQKDPETKLEYACQFASKILKDHERLFNIAELECMAVAWAVNKFRYLTVFKFTVYTDNAAVKWLFSINN